MSLSVDYNGVSVSFDERDVIDELEVHNINCSSVEVLGYDEYGVEYTAVGEMSCEELVEIYEDTVWPVEGESFSVPDDEVEELEWLVDNMVDDGSWEGR